MEFTRAALAADADWGHGELHPAERALVKALASFPDEIAEAAIKQAQDNLRALILAPGEPDFWTVSFRL